MDDSVEMASADANLLALYDCISSRERLSALENEGETQQGGASSDEDQAGGGTIPQANKRSCCPGPRRGEQLEAC